MFKYLLVLMLLLVILPVNAFDVTTCPICPAPQFVYVTVTPLPTPTPVPQVVYINAPADQQQTAPQQGYLITDTQITVLKYGAVAIVIVLILAGAAIFIVKRRRKNTGKKPQKLIITKNIDELFEETEDEPEPEPEPEPKPKPEKKKFKSPKKGKSLLDQDFEF